MESRVLQQHVEHGSLGVFASLDGPDIHRTMSNDIVRQLGIQGVGFAGRERGAPWFAARVIPESETPSRHTLPRLGHDRRLRDTFACSEYATDKVWRRFSPATLADVGLFPKPRLLPNTTGYSTEFGFNDGSGMDSQPPPQPAAVSSARRCAANEPAQLGL